MSQKSPQLELSRRVFALWRGHRLLKLSHGCYCQVRKADNEGLK